VEALRRAGLGLRVVAVKSLRRWVIWWLSESVKVWAVVAAGVCGGAVGGDLWRGGDGIVERVRRARVERVRAEMSAGAGL